MDGFALGNALDPGGRGALAEEIHTAALANGMIDLERYAALLLTEGLTTSTR